MTKPLVIYHDNCADGFGAAFAAWLALGDSAEYLPQQYGKLGDYERMRELFSGRDVYILDFSLPREFMDMAFESAKRVVWLDHHKTAFEMWGCMDDFARRGYVAEQRGEGLIILDNNRSGAMLAWEYFNPHYPVPVFVRHIDDYDRWQFKIDGTKEFNKALWSYAPWSFDQWAKWNNADGLCASEFRKEGAAILRAHDQNVQSVVKGAARKCTVWFPMPDGGWRVTDTCMAHGLAANCPPHLTSDVGHELANQSGTFGLCWTLNQTTPVANCSLRSNGDYDVSAVAKAFGGGGHKNAAGFEVPIATLLEWMV